mmetsp:Transcript_22264/g.77167  ORF Transcript_22264/g.77167 Transcript_22264/m.77167 type:complete len:231 (+) Transcript_22264:1312-2004(+)
MERELVTIVAQPGLPRQTKAARPARPTRRLSWRPSESSPEVGGGCTTQMKCPRSAPRWSGTSSMSETPSRAPRKAACVRSRNQGEGSTRVWPWRTKETTSVSACCSGSVDGGRTSQLRRFQSAPQICSNLLDSSLRRPATPDASVKNAQSVSSRNPSPPPIDSALTRCGAKRPGKLPDAWHATPTSPRTRLTDLNAQMSKALAPKGMAIASMVRRPQALPRCEMIACPPR